VIISDLSLYLYYSHYKLSNVIFVINKLQIMLLWTIFCESMFFLFIQMDAISKFLNKQNLTLLKQRFSYICLVFLGSSSLCITTYITS